MKALILAAGYATRLYPLTRSIPKFLLPLGEGVIGDYIVRSIDSIDAVSNIVIVSNAKFAPQIRQWVNDRSFNKPVSIVSDGSTSVENRLGAIGDIKFVLEQEGFGDDWLIVAGDNVYTFALRGYVDYFYEVEKDCILVQHMDRISELQRVGVAQLDDSARVVGLTEKPERPQTDIGVLAIYLFRKETLRLFEVYLREGNNRDAPGHFTEWLYKRKELRAFFAEGACYDVGTHEAYDRVKRLFKEQL